MPCFLCKSQDVSESENFMNGYYQYNCPNCGKYEISKSLIEDINDGAYITKIEDKSKKRIRSSEVIFKAACLAAEKKLKGLDNYFLHQDERRFNKENGIHIIDFIKDFPENPIDRLNRALLNIGRLNPAFPFRAIALNNNQAFHTLFASIYMEAVNLLDYFNDEGLIDIKNKLDQPGNIVSIVFVITPKGWFRISELQKYYKENSSKAFLAMWFDKTTENFRKEVQKGAELAGYQLLVVDEEHHNDFIMNKVLNMIDEAKFVITDFTCIPEEDYKPEENIKVKGGIRGGVYFEAGYAKGQAKEVIMTCNDSLAACKRRHFDVDQINTIFWKERAGEIITSQGEVPMYEYMRERIIQSVGKGPLDK